MILLSLFKDPLIAGRMVSVIAGLGSLVGIFLLGRELFKSTRIGLMSSFIYVISPFSLLYDRMALYDSLIAMFIIWSMYFTVLLVRHVRLDIAMIFGMIVGGGLLTKSSAQFAFILLPFSFLLYPFKKRLDKKRLGKYLLFLIVAVIIANAIALVMRLSPFYYIVGQKNLTFIYSFSEWIRSPFAFVLGNLKGMIGWLSEYMTTPFLILILASFIISKKFMREKLFLFAWFIIPFMALAFFGKVIYPRYLLFMVMPLFILGAYALTTLLSLSRKKWIRGLLLFVYLFAFVITDFLIIKNITKAPIAMGDRDQMIFGWSAGGGVQESVAYLQNEAKDKKIFVGTQGTFGLMPYAFEIYTKTNPNIMIKGYWPLNEQIPQGLLEKSKEMPTYVYFYQSCGACEGTGLVPKSWPVTKVLQYKKSENVYATLYKVLPQ